MRDDLSAETLLTSAEIRAAFPAPIPSVQTSWLYRSGLIAVVACLILLQLIYLALVAAVGIGVGLYIVQLPAIIARIHINWFTIVLIVSPIFAGAVTFFFMLKPLLAKRVDAPTPIEVTPADQPQLFEFVAALCDRLGSPKPSRILVDLEINASASLGAGWRSLFRDRPVLTIGLPLVRGLTLNQLTGVLAHEFGHFSQRAGMRSYVLIHLIQHWFARVAYERDQWDAWLENWREEAGNRTQIIIGVARLAVWISRGILKLLLHAANFISSAFSRQMEYNADLHEVAVVGPDVSESIHFALRTLSAASHQSWGQIQQDWKNRRLVANFPELVHLHWTALPDEAVSALRAEELETTTGRYSTHPATVDRIANTRRFGGTGIFNLPGPATRLIRDFDGLCAHVTEHRYRLDLGDRYIGIQLLGAGELAVHFDREQSYAAALHQVMGPVEVAPQWFTIEGRQEDWQFRPPQPIDESAYLEKLQTLVNRESGITLLSTRVNIKPESFQLSRSNIDTAMAEASEARQAFRHAAVDLINVSRGLAARINVGIMRAAPLQLTGPDWDGAVVLRAYNALAAEAEALREMRIALIRYQDITSNKALIPAAECANAIESQTSRAATLMGQIIARLNPIESDLTIGGHTVSLAHALSPENLSDSIECAVQLVNSSDRVGNQLLGRLCWLTLEVERIAETSPPSPAALLPESRLL